MTEDEIHSAFVSWLNGLLDPPVIKAYPEEDTSAAIVVVNHVQTREVRANAQFDAYSNLETAGGEVVIVRPQVETEWHFSVHAYGLSKVDPATNLARSPVPPVPTQILRPLVAAAQLRQILEPLAPSFHIHEISPIRNVPDWVNNRWQARAQVDIYLRGVVADGFAIDVIEEIEPTLYTREQFTTP